MKKVANLFSDALTKGGIIEKEEAAICSYGLELLLLAGLEFASILIFAIFAGNFFYTVLFFASFLPLRIYAGGYHADTHLRCYLILLLVYGLFSAFMYVPTGFYLPIEVISAVLTIGVVRKLAPIIHHNKTANETERAVYRKISIKIMAVETVLLLAGMLWKRENRFVFAFSLGQFAVAFSMLAAFVKNKGKGGKVNEKVL